MPEVQERGAELWRGVALIVLTGAVLGTAYNALGRQPGAGWGLAWVGEAPETALATLGDPPANAAPAGAPEAYRTDSDDPLAVPAPAALSEIPELGRPIRIEIAALKSYVDAGAILLVDAREAHEYAEGHIAGAINLPFDEVVTDPLRLEQLDSGGKPIVTYCGGGGCELSLSLAQELVAAGHRRVLVYMGGFPEWVEAGYPVERSTSGG